MSVFKLTDDDARRYAAFTERVEGLAGRLNDEDAREVKLLAKRFQNKVKDFFNDERRLNIGIIGQVKAGKSSFLNTLLFEGRPVLPKASTPKTATLTKIGYADENAIEIEYYTEDEWEQIVENAGMDLDGDEYKSARELTHMVRESGVDAAGLLAKKKELVPFGSYEELMERLNEYVGENGKYTALVKAAVLHVNNPLFREISIVDTPGLNDPIVSRTLRTKDFIEVCDVVFFLTPCGAFLDKSDWRLLSTQLPQKGVKRLTLVGSKFDSGLRDVLRKSDPDDPFGNDPNTADTIPAARELVTAKLTKRARDRVEEYGRDMRARGADEALIRVLDGCREPLFVSSMAQNMAGRPPDGYDAEERNVYDALAEFSGNLAAELSGIGGFAAARAVQNEVAAEKEEILRSKSESLLSIEKENLLGLLDGFQTKAKGRLTVLSGNDRQQLVAMKNELQGQINKVRADILTEMTGWLTQVEEKKAEGIRVLRSAAQSGQTLEERSGTETKTESYRVSDSSWWNPFSWGSSHTEHYTYESSYSYIAASDAADRIRNFAMDSESRIEKAFSDSVNHQAMKRRLLAIIAEDFSMGDERYDASLFRAIVEEQIARIEFPIIQVNCGGVVESIVSRFSGEIRSAQEKDRLKHALAEAIKSVFSTLADSFDRSAAAFKASLSGIGDSLQNTLLQSVNAEFDSILKDLDERDANIARLTAYTVELERLIKEARE